MIRLDGVIGWLLECLFEWVFQWSLFFSSLGLLAAYFVSSKLGWDPDRIAWLLALAGFAFGLRFDYEAFRSGDRTSRTGVSMPGFAFLGYIAFAFVLMAVEVGLVLSSINKA